MAGNELPAEARGLLDAIAAAESKGSWNTIYGGGTFDDYSAHPRQYVTITSGPNKGKKSSAAGKFQILASTYDEVAPKLGITDFSPESQEKIAWYLANQAYGPGLTEALRDPAQYGQIGKKLSGVWTSLPGGIETAGNANQFAEGVSAGNKMAGQSKSDLLNAWGASGDAAAPAMSREDLLKQWSAPAAAEGAGSADRQRLLQQWGVAGSPPEGAKPGSREYAQWALEQARSGNKLPMVSEHDFSVPDENSWRKSLLVPVETNRATGKTRWATPQVVDSLIGAITLPADVLYGKTPLDPGVAWKDQDPATLDRAATLASLPAGELTLAARNMVPATVRNALMANGAQIPKLAATELTAAGYTPNMLMKELEGLGPGGVVGDLTPGLQARVGALARTAGPAKDVVVNALTDRNKLANLRIQAGLEGLLGEAPIPSQMGAQFDQNRLMAGQAYPKVFREKALSDNYLMDAAPIAAAIDEMTPGVVGSTRAKVEAVKRMLVDPETGKYTTSPEVIHAVRQELDGMVGEETNRNTARVLGDLRKAIDIDLGAEVPGLKAADAQFQEVMRQIDAYESGQKALRSGETGLHPVDVAATMTEGALPAGTFIGPSGAAFRFRQGMVSDIARIVGNKANDRVALKEILKGEGSWNREKLVAAFGEDKASQLIKLFENEAKMAETEKMAFQNSVTETIKGGKEGIEAPAQKDGVLRNALNLEFGDAAARFLDNIVGGGSNQLRNARNLKLANALLATVADLQPAAVPVGMSTGSAMVPRLSGAATLNALIEQGKRGGVLPKNLRNMLMSPAVEKAQ